MKKSILKKLQFYMTCFGIAMGLVFPVYANFFVEWKKGMFLFFVIGCILAGITVGVVSFLFVKIILLNPLIKVSDLAKNIKGNDVSGKIEIESHDAVGDIVNGLNAAAANMRRFICEIERISNIIEGIVNSGTGNKNAETYLSNIENSLIVVNETTSNISELSGDIIHEVTLANEKVNRSQINLSDTSNDVKGLSELISSMVTNSGKIQSVVELIRDISKKTNILSLNASIEAARAGEHGKSFAIVAQEIRKLAQNVGDSASDITKTVNFIQNDISIALVFVETINKHVAENRNDSNEIKDKLNEIKTITNFNQSANNDMSQSVETLNDSFLKIQDAFDKLSQNITDLQKFVDIYHH